MNKPTHAVLGCLLGFALGAVIAVQRERTQSRALQPPAVLREIAPLPSPQRVTRPIRPEEAARLDREMREIEHRQAQFEQEYSALNNSYRQRIVALLNAAQANAFVSNSAVSPARPASQDLAEAPKLSGEASQNHLIGQFRPKAAEDAGPNAFTVLAPDALQSILELTFVSWSMENLTAELQLAPTQQQAIRALLLERRQKFLELVDQTPPPSLRLLSLAETIRRQTAAAPTVGPQPFEHPK